MGDFNFNGAVFRVQEVSNTLKQLVVDKFGGGIRDNYWTI